MSDARDNIEQLLEVMARLRDPRGGCPWDLEQDFSTIAPYTVEEAFEVADAIAAGDMDELRDELGDLLFQVVFHARMAEEEGRFDFSDVAAGLVEKMVRRHPHVFGDEQGASMERIDSNWESIKAAEQSAKGQRRESVLDGVPAGLPALQRSVKIQKKAARVGFDWPESRQVLAQVRSELDELEQAMDDGEPDAVTDELGDLFFTVSNLSRHLRNDPDMALRAATHKFERRFCAMEAMARENGQNLADLEPDDLEALWVRVKTRNKGQGARGKA